MVYAREKRKKKKDQECERSESGKVKTKKVEKGKERKVAGRRALLYL